MPLGFGGVCVLAHKRIALVAAVRDLQSTLIRRIEEDPVKTRPASAPLSGGAAVEGSGGRGSRRSLRPKRKSGAETDFEDGRLGEPRLLSPAVRWAVATSGELPKAVALLTPSDRLSLRRSALIHGISVTSAQTKIRRTELLHQV